ncbi:hypothetical protein METP3_03091 [Methanosarcinales archaeon]|nr:hypothetical protein METP3_03091 [Methanosarcinales archaeon]
MKLNDNSEIEWTEKIESTSMVRDPLGLWSHLNIQVDYVPGITSVTNRIRYYSLLSWYYENLFNSKILDPKEFERLFILTCLSHHEGDHSDPSLGHVFNKQRFKDDWDLKRSFKLDFPINGFARTYYNRQLDILRCCWTDQFNQIHKSKINHELARFFPDVDTDFFKKKHFTREDILDNFSDFCICNEYDAEIDVMTSLLFGFMNNKGSEWFIDEESYEKFIGEGVIDFDFKGFELDTDEILTSNAPIYIEMNQRRRNSLFMFLKIIGETEPLKNELYKAIWDSIYFKQNTYTQEIIDFKGLNNILKYWELLQLNVYYVYSLEMILDVIQEIVYDETGIKKDKILSSLDTDLILSELSELCEVEVDIKTNLNEVINSLYSICVADEGLKTQINESIIYDNISKAEDLEVILANAILMLFLLKRRFESIDKQIINGARIEKNIYIKDKLRIDILFNYIEQNRNKDVFLFLNYLIQSIIERHLYEANVRMSWGTKNWLFVEEDSRLFFSRKDTIRIHPRDNRWNSMLNLMQDINMIDISDNIILTDKGKEWLKQAKLI